MGSRNKGGASETRDKQASAFGKSLGIRAKNDLLDAEILLEYGKRMKPHPKEPVSESVGELKQFISRRSQLNKMLVSEKTMLSLLIHLW
ncbi:MAG: hypothetical protein R3A13_06140 [Bdellovibrionota bacterium]